MSFIEVIRRLLGGGKKPVPGMDPASRPEVPVREPPLGAKPSLAMTKAPCAHWQSSGTFPVSVAGESYRKGHIAQIAQNTNGAGALVFCTALLELEDDNAYDSSAIAVFIDGGKIGYLGKELAPLFRQVLVNNNIKGTTSCDAVIHGGGRHGDRVYEYAVELDLTLMGEPPRFNGEKGKFPTPLRCSPAPVLLRHTDTEFFLKIPYLDRGTLDECRPNCRLTAWTRPDSDELFLYAPGSIGGSGRVTVLSEREFPDLMQSWGNYPYLTVYRREGRALILRGGVECDPRFAFKERDTVSVVLLHLDLNAPVTQVAAANFLIDFGAGNGKLKQSTEPSLKLIQLNTQGTDALQKLVALVDAVVSFDSEGHKRALKPFLGKLVEDKPWSCLQRMWGAPQQLVDVQLATMLQQANVSRAGQEGIEADCQAILGVLLSHTGKTKQSRTYIGALLKQL